MDPVEKEKFQRLFEMTEENNLMLKKMRKSQQMTSYSRVFYWIVIIVISFGGYIALKPMLSSLMSIYSGGNMSTLKSALDEYKNLQGSQ